MRCCLLVLWIILDNLMCEVPYLSLPESQISPTVSRYRALTLKMWSGSPAGGERLVDPAKD